jgi:NADH-quinone oxidoreductase subunit G
MLSGLDLLKHLRKRGEKANKMVELTIDGKKIRTYEGKNILKAALDHGIKIPHFCYDTRLKRYGGCRMCLVEIEGRQWPLTACSTPVKQGMVVTTDTPQIRRARQTVLELLLIHHPMECPICDKAGECDLQDLVFEYGKPEARFKRVRMHAPPDVRGPLIELDSNRCILCGKCVRICAEHQGRGALGLIGRGFDTVVQPAFGEVLECDYCGQCVDICPVGAIVNKTFKYKTRAWFLEESDTVCPFCSVGCTVTLGLVDGTIMRARGREKTGITDGNLCGRGRFGFDSIYSENRLTSPLIRKMDELTPVSWEEAFVYISDNLKTIIKDYGPQSIGALGSPRCTSEANYRLWQFMKKVIGSENLDSSACLGYRYAREAFSQAFGISNNPAAFGSPLGKDAIVVIESDICSSHPVYGLFILQAQREGAELIVIDSRENKLTWHSTQWLNIRPGTAVALINGIMKVIIDNNAFKCDEVSQIPGFSELEIMLEDYTLEKVSDITGVSMDAIIAAARTIALSSKRLIALTLSIFENNKGLDTALAACNLTIIIGDSPQTLQIPSELANTWGCENVGITPYRTTSMSAHDMLYSPPGHCKALYIMGEDPVVSFPDTKTVTDNLKDIDFLVVQDIAMTETARLAHAVLPARAWAEKEGTYANMSGLSQPVKKLVKAQGQTLPDHMILQNLSLSMEKKTDDLTFKDLKKKVNKIITHKPQEVKKTFRPVPYIPVPEPDETYPFTLVIRGSLYHSGTMSTRSKSIDLVQSEATVEINPDDAHKQGIKNKSHVKVISHKGEVYLKATVTPEVPRGVLFTNTHFPHGLVNMLTEFPEKESSWLTVVRIEKV